MPNKLGSKKGIRKKYCSKCAKEKEVESKRYCRACAAEHMRKWRKLNPLTETQKIKAKIRWKTNVYVKRGLIKKFPCETCDSLDVQAYHENYNDPYNIHWLCSKCHKEADI
jgi:hypothetical protein